jgi:hypothetical protein
MDFLRKQSLLRRRYGYLKLEDTEEKNHQRAQFLIFKILEQADSSKRHSYLRIRIYNLKVKIGKRFKKLKGA